jgi:hypothetical protein
MAVGNNSKCKELDRTEPEVELSAYFILQLYFAIETIATTRKIKINK